MTERPFEEVPAGSGPRRDVRRRFLIESCDVRGELVRLDRSLAEAIARTEYPRAIERVLGETFVAANLLAGTIKFDGKMTLQVRGDGPVHLLVVQVTHDGGFRGLARWGEGDDGVPAVSVADDATVAELFGEGARMIITIEASDRAEPYQGIVPFEGDSVASALEHYFRTSEQLATELHLAVRDGVAAGLLLQKLPAGERRGEPVGPGVDAGVETDRSDGWRRATALAATVTAEELCTRGDESLLDALFHEEDVRLFEPADVRFECGCSRERTDGMLLGLGRAEIDAIVAEQGAVEITCEFCDARYRYDPVDVEALFKGAPGAAEGAGTLH